MAPPAGRGPTAWRHRARSLAGTAAGVMLVAAAVVSGRPPAVTLNQTFESKEALAGAVLTALAHRDRTALASLPITQEEFQRLVWPELPASRPEVNLPWSYAWNRLRQQGDSFLTVLLDRHGGERYELVRVEFLGETTRHNSFLVYRKTELVVRDDTGAELRVRLFGSLLERRGAWKLVSYVVD